MEITKDKRKDFMTLWSFCFQHLKGNADACVEIQNQIS
jgi:hypothetical protein